MLSCGTQPVPQLQLTTLARLLTQIYHVNNSGTVFASLQSATSQASIHHLYSSQHCPPSSHNSSKALTRNSFSNPTFQTPSQSSQDKLVRPVTATVYPLVSISVLLTFCYWDKDHEQEHLEEERVYFTAQLTIQLEGKAGQDPTAGTEAKTTEEFCSPICTLLAYSVSFLHPPGHPGTA